MSLAIWYLLVGCAAASVLTDGEYALLPQPFHLDDYDRCLSQKDGLYCLGTFHVTPTHRPHYIYHLMEEVTSNPYNFNRTLLRRGYCVSARCPSPERNATLRFERCAAARARPLALRTALHNLHYCRTHRDYKTPISISPEQQLFTRIVYGLLVLNIIGTAYDVMTGDNRAKNSLLTAWSIPANWRRLTATHVGGDPRLTALSPLQGVRVIGLASITFAHAIVMHYSFFMTNPEYLDKLTMRSDGVFLSNGTIFVHMFLMMTSFLTAYNLLLYSQRRPLGLHMLPMCIYKRITRILPAYLLIVGYAATWWPHARDGPLVSSTIGENSKICLKKFWTHALFVNNIVDKEEICVIPSWYLPVDMHLYILACFLTLIIWRHRRQAMLIYGTLFAATCLVNVVLTYANDWKSMVYYSTSENIRTVYRGVESFSHFYTSTWGALPACFLGLFLGHLHFELQEKGFQYQNYKWLVFFHNISLPVGVMWMIYSGKYAQHHTARAFTAAYTGVERIMFFFFITGLVYGMVVIDGPIRRFFAWRGWQSMGRMSLSVMLLHWIVNMVIAARPVAYSSSILDATVDWLATQAITYALAVPVTVLVELPMQKFFGALI